MAEGEISTFSALTEKFDLPGGSYKKPKLLYCSNGGHFLRILPDGTVDGTRDRSDEHSEQTRGARGAPPHREGFPEHFLEWDQALPGSYLVGRKGWEEPSQPYKVLRKALLFSLNHKHTCGFSPKLNLSSGCCCVTARQFRAEFSLQTLSPQHEAVLGEG